jgi:hypothetical protein
MDRPRSGRSTDPFLSLYATTGMMASRSSNRTRVEAANWKAILLVRVSFT